jgi:hypothetical protein
MPPYDEGLKSAWLALALLAGERLPTEPITGVQRYRGTYLHAPKSTSSSRGA